jgi:hypothetical protein
MAEIVVETRSLTKVYRDFWGRKKKVALNALDLTIEKGEIFGLLGPPSNSSSACCSPPAAMRSSSDSPPPRSRRTRKSATCRKNRTSTAS